MGDVHPFGDLRSSGLLWLINRTVFHPRGLALALVADETGDMIGWRLVGDGSEPMWFAPEDDVALYALAMETMHQQTAVPPPAGGAHVQPR